MSSFVPNIHASCIRLGAAGGAFQAPEDAGILLLGASGAGKSDLALRLIAAGAMLVADDRVELFVKADILHARAPVRTSGLLEVRGLGVMAMPYRQDARIALAVTLVREIERLPEPAFFVPEHLDLPVPSRPPLISIVPNEPSAPAKIAAAAAAFAQQRFRDTVKPLP